MTRETRARKVARAASHPRPPARLNELVAALGPAAEQLAHAALEKAFGGPGSLAATTELRVVVELQPSRAIAVLVRPPSGDWIEANVWVGDVAMHPGSNAASTYPGPADAAPDLPTFRHPCPGAVPEGLFGPTNKVGEPAAVYAGVSYPHFHHGVDFRAAAGHPVVAAADGVVESVDLARSSVVISHAGPCVTDYGHLGSVLVKAGQHVSAGEPIGAFGRYAAFAELPGFGAVHFSLYGRALAGPGKLQPVDPLPYLAAGHLPAETEAAP